MMRYLKLRQRRTNGWYANGGGSFWTAHTGMNAYCREQTEMASQPELEFV